ADMKDRLFAAAAEDAIVSRALTGKPCRILRSAYTEAWSRPDAPKPLTFPLQSILAGEPLRRAERARRLDYWTYSIGQIVGEIERQTTGPEIFAEALAGYGDAVDPLEELVAAMRDPSRPA